MWSPLIWCVLDRIGMSCCGFVQQIQARMLGKIRGKESPSTIAAMQRHSSVARRVVDCA